MSRPIASRPRPDEARTPRGPNLVRPVHTRLVTRQWAPRVVSPLHDALTEGERRTVLADNPDSYLHVTSDPLARPGVPGDEMDDGVQARALQRLLDQGAYRSLPEPSVFVYLMREGGREHTGVVASVDLAGFADGRVLGHEGVQPARVESLVRHFARVPMRSELVSLFHRADPAVLELTSRAIAQPPALEFTDAWGIEQSVWLPSPEESAAVAEHLSSHRHYIADGHHRVAAALRSRPRDGRRADAAILCALYPQDQVSLHAFHRRVHGPVAVAPLVEALASRFDVARVAGPEVRPGSIGMYAAGRWHLLAPLEPPRATGVAGLDVTLLNETILEPLLGIRDADPRLDFVPGPEDLEVSVRACDGDGGVLFTLHAPHLDDLVSVAERHEAMSPKTTYVNPKPRSGIFLS